MKRWTYTKGGKKSTRDLLDKSADRVADAAMNEIFKLGRNPDSDIQARMGNAIRKAMFDALEATDARDLLLEKSEARR